MTIDANGNWTYTLDNANAAVQALPLNATLNDTVTVTAIDGTTHDITVTITGINDAAVVSGDDQGAVTEDNDPATLTDTGVLSISDVDTGEAVFTADTIAGTWDPSRSMLPETGHTQRTTPSLRSSHWARVKLPRTPSR